MLKIKDKKSFKNGLVYALETNDGFPVETTDTFLPFYTKDAIGRCQNKLTTKDIGNRLERWLIGLSCMSGCPIGCKFCATGQLKKHRNLTSEEMIDQFEFIMSENKEYDFNSAKEHKINYTRMGEPFLNINAIKETINYIDSKYQNTHHYISTIGIKGSDFSWIEGNITLQISVHALNDEKRDWLIPIRNKMTLKELGQIRTKSNLKTTINLTLVDESDFDINILKEYFSPEFFFVKLSPLNESLISKKNNLSGIITGNNLI